MYKSQHGVGRKTVTARVQFGRNVVIERGKILKKKMWLTEKMIESS